VGAGETNGVKKMKTGHWLFGVLGSLILIFVSASPAGATFLTATSASFTASSEPGDTVGGGTSYSLASGGATFNSKSDGNRIEIDVYTQASPGPTWMLFFSAPTGQQLLPGLYSDIAALPGSQTGGSLSISGPGGACNTTSGSFTVLDATYGPNGYVASFDATFEQHCEGAAAALRGEIALTNSAPPPALTVDLTIDKNGSLKDGRAVISGSMQCNRDANVNPAIILTAVEQTPGGLATGSDNQLGPGYACTTKTRPWKAVITSMGSAPFSRGYATVSATTNVLDEFYSDYLDYGTLIFATADETNTIHLTAG
jgi:hypothetical protein